MSSLSAASRVFINAYLERQFILNYTSLIIPTNDNPTIAANTTKTITVPNFAYYFDFFSVELPRFLSDALGNVYTLTDPDRAEIQIWQLGVIDALRNTWGNLGAPFSTTIATALTTARTRVATTTVPTVFITMTAHAYIKAYIPLRDVADYQPTIVIPTANNPTTTSTETTRVLTIHNFAYEYDFFSISLPVPLVVNGVSYSLMPNDRLQIKAWQLGVLDAWLAMWNNRGATYASVRTAITQARTRVNAIT